MTRPLSRGPSSYQTFIKDHSTLINNITLLWDKSIQYFIHKRQLQSFISPRLCKSMINEKKNSSVHFAKVFFGIESERGEIDESKACEGGDESLSFFLIKR